MVKLQLVNQTNDIQFEQKTLMLHLKKNLSFLIARLQKMRVRNKFLLNSPVLLTFVFLSKADMKKINYQFRKKNKPTDVLSFAPIDSSEFGELLFCVDVLRKQAANQKQSLGQELTYMIIHGVLHLLGYDHEISIKEEKIMFTLQDKLFQELTEADFTLNYLK